MGFRELLQQQGPVILDGSMGVLLMRSGLKLGEHPEVFNITHPDVVKKIHTDYIEAGAQAVYTNTFGASSNKLVHAGYTVDEVVTAAVKIAKEAARPYSAYVGLDIGPLGELLEPMGTLKFDEAYELFREQVVAGVAAGVDFVIVETIADLYEMKAAILAVREHCDLPLMATMTFEPNHRTFVGCDIKSMALTLEALGVDVLGINCSLGPAEILPICEELMQWTTLPVLIKPNAGLPSIVDGEAVYDLTAQEFADTMAKYLDLGVKLIGGCCGSDPEFIRLMVEATRGREIKKTNPHIPPAVCTPSNVVAVDRVRVVGERINPTGKKRFKEALLQGDLDYIVQQGISQVEAGAEILDVNVGLPGIDQKDMMVKVVRALQDVVDVPLQIDTSEIPVMEAALRYYSGKPIVNSVNGEAANMEAIFPLIKKYGAAVIGLTLDERGIPESAQQRFEIAKRIVETAERYGIPRRDVYIDCLTLTVSAQQENAVETLKAVQMVREQLGVKTLLGVSNISFGLPVRQVMNQAFLTQALYCGLDLPIINPNDGPMMDAIFAHRALSGSDPACGEYIDRFAARQQEAATATPKGPVVEDIAYYIGKGLQEGAVEKCKELLETHDPLVVVSDHLIPVLDEVGKRYEEGKIFLPQLIQSAEAAKAAFEVVRGRIAGTTGSDAGGEKIVVATVKGDIHDIGKNIVKVVLENYGYRVIDLGRDVPIEAVVEAAKEHNAKLVGLSALMTTTVGSMEDTIKALRQSGQDCKVMVGGAVLTEDYAMEIGADHYARDAQQAVAIAKKIFA